MDLNVEMKLLSQISMHRRNGQRVFIVRFLWLLGRGLGEVSGLSYCVESIGNLGDYVLVAACDLRNQALQLFESQLVSFFVRLEQSFVRLPKPIGSGCFSGVLVLQKAISRRRTPGCIAEPKL